MTITSYSILRHWYETTSKPSSFYNTHSVSLQLHLLDSSDFCSGMTLELDGKDRVAADQFESEIVFQSLKYKMSNNQINHSKELTTTNTDAPHQVTTWLVLPFWHSGGQCSNIWQFLSLTGTEMNLTV